MIELEPWHWATIGLCLSLIEFFVPSFVFLLIGLAAVFTGGIAYIVELQTYQEILIFAVFSAFDVFVWFKVVKPRIGDQSTSHDLQTAMNTQLGYVTFNTTPEQTGKLRFNIPVQGKEVWDYRCEQALRLGDTVRILRVDEANLLIVEKKKEALI